MKKPALRRVFNAEHTLPIVGKILTIFFEYCKHRDGISRENVANVSLFSNTSLRLPLQASI